MLGKGLSNQRTYVPDLIGMNLESARNKILGASLTLVTSIFDNTVITGQDSADAFVYKQNPDFGVDATLQLGSSIYLWLTLDSARLPVDSTMVITDTITRENNQDCLIKLMYKKLIIYIAFLLCYPALSNGQEIVTGLQNNTVLSGKVNKQDWYKAGAADPVELPFFDDFTGRSFLPSPKWWSDNYAFINNTYSNQQITIGIATLDALDNGGKLYETATSEGFEADHLTSQPVNLNYPINRKYLAELLLSAGRAW